MPPTGTSLPSGLDHLVYAVRDLEGGMDRVEALLGLRPVPGGRHPRWGTRNAVLPLGPKTYLEVVAPDPERGETEPGIFRLDSIREPRLVTWAARVGHIEERVEHAGSRGVRLGEIREGSRETTDGIVLRWRLTDPAVVVGDGLVPFLIDWGDTPHPAAGYEGPLRLVDLRAEHPEPTRIRAMLQALDAEIPVSPGPTPRLAAIIETPAGEVELS